MFERPPKSGVWWVQWYDGEGKRHREKAGTKATAIKLKAKRTTDKLEARKIPETLRRTREVSFQSLMDDALENSIHENGKSAISNLKGMMNALAPAFGKRAAASIATEELTIWFVNGRGPYPRPMVITIPM